MTSIFALDDTSRTGLTAWIDRWRTRHGARRTVWLGPGPGRAAGVPLAVEETAEGWDYLLELPGEVVGEVTTQAAGGLLVVTGERTEASGARWARTLVRFEHTMPVPAEAEMRSRRVSVHGSEITIHLCRRPVTEMPDI